MNFYNILFPARCPFCSKVIKDSMSSCNECSSLTKLHPYSQLLSNGCICISAFPHKGVYRKAVLNYKFYNNKQYYRQFSFILKHVIEDGYSESRFDLFTSVPMHRKKRKTRGFNQVELIAKHTAKLMHQPYAELLLQTSLNKEQHTLKREERIENVKGIYACINEKKVSDKNILIFDDIITTGSVLLECTNTLLKSGARSVCCVTINY